MDSNLVVDDDYVNEVGKQCTTRESSIAEDLNQFSTILGKITNNAIIGGDTADAVGTFSEDTEKLKESLDNTSTGEGEDAQNAPSTESLCNSFITEVNDADQYLY